MINHKNTPAHTEITDFQLYIAIPAKIRLLWDFKEKVEDIANLKNG